MKLIIWLKSLFMRKRLLNCIKDGNIEEVKCLLKKGIKPSLVIASFFYQESPIVTATKINSIELVKLLLRYGANVNERDFYTQQRALWRAIFNGNIEMAKILLDAGANPNITVKLNYNCLFLAVQGRHEDMVKLLLSRGAFMPLKTVYDTWFRMPPNTILLVMEHTSNVSIETLNACKRRKRLYDEAQANYF